VAIRKDQVLLAKFVDDLFKKIEKLVGKINVVGDAKGKEFNQKLPLELGKAVSNIYSLLSRSSNNTEDLIQFTLNDKEKAESLSLYIQEYIKMFDIEKMKQLCASIPKNKNLEFLDYIKEILIKIKTNQVSVSDLFTLIDQDGDGNGTVGIEEFQRLSHRLGFSLTKHRIHELFAEIKEELPEHPSNGDTNLLELNKEEFKKAIDYLKRKQVWQAMKMMGITPDVLFSYLAYLTCLLLLLFSFIFLGIKAFAIGGAFSAIINSVLPGIGAVSISSQDDNEKKLSEENVKSACQASMSFLHSHNK